MIVWEIERLPYQSHPGFDCQGDHANCPVCAAHGEANHGISGGKAWFGVRTRLPDGRALAAVLCVLRCDYPATVRARGRQRLRSVGACIGLHTQGDAIECSWVPGGRCAGDTERGAVAWGFAAELYAKHGTADGGPEQPEALWTELGKWLVAQAEFACGMVPR
jgi:hypothetical protein